MKHLLIKMAAIANELDKLGCEKEANNITLTMLKIAQGAYEQPIEQMPGQNQQMPGQNQPVQMLQQNQQNQQKNIENDYIAQQIENLKAKYSTLNDEASNFENWSQNESKYFEASIFAVKFRNGFAQLITDASTMLKSTGFYNLQPYQRKEYLDSLFEEILPDAKNVLQKALTTLENTRGGLLQFIVPNTKNTIVNLENTISGIQAGINEITNLINQPSQGMNITPIQGTNHFLMQQQDVMAQS